MNLDASESTWAGVREAQAKALSLPNTGMAVTIDIGEAGNIHPADKPDVGSRLALAARHVAYRDAGVVYSGPADNSMKTYPTNIVYFVSPLRCALDHRVRQNTVPRRQDVGAPHTIPLLTLQFFT